VALTATAGGALLLAGATAVGLGLVALFVVGLGQTITSITQNTAIQVQVSDLYRGRVLSVYLMMLFIGVPLGTFLLGLAAQAAGIRAASLTAGVLLAGYVLIGVFVFGGMRVLDVDREPVPADALETTNADLAATEAIVP
jgi:hypothetical protein